MRPRRRRIRDAQEAAAGALPRATASGRLGYARSTSGLLSAVGTYRRTDRHDCGLSRESPTSRANGACGRHVRHDKAGIKLMIEPSGWRSRIDKSMSPTIPQPGDERMRLRSHRPLSPAADMPLGTSWAAMCQEAVVHQSHSDHVIRG